MPSRRPKTSTDRGHNVAVRRTLNERAKVRARELGTTRNEYVTGLLTQYAAKQVQPETGERIEFHLPYLSDAVWAGCMARARAEHTTIGQALDALIEEDLA